MNIDYLAVLFRVLHILPAIIAVGGTIFMRAALLPTVSQLPDAERQRVHDGVRSRWSKWVMGSIAFLLVSGLFNFFMIINRYDLPKPAYHALFGIKFLLALAIFTVASFFVGRTSVAQRMRSNARFWLNLNIAMAVVLVCISAAMRNLTMNAPRKADTAAAKTAATARVESDRFPSTQFVADSGDEVHDG